MLTRIRAKYRDSIDKQFLASLFAVAEKKQSNLRSMIRYHYETGGKRIRPLCVALAAEAEWMHRGHQDTDENISRLIMPFAVAVEMIHNATLIHDDLQDGDQFRRNQPTLWKKFSPEQAINCGDLLFFIALRTIQNGDYSAAISVDLQRLVTSHTEHVIEGQGEEFSLKELLQKESKFPSQDDYEKMVLGKTGALFSMPLLGGAMIAGASEESKMKLKRGAASLGFAFQIQDDYIDLWGDKGRDQCGSDIAEGKLSYPIIECIETLAKNSSIDADLKKMAGIIAKGRSETSPSEIDWVIGLIESTGAKEASYNRFQSLQGDFKETGYWQPVLESLFERLGKNIKNV